MKLTALEKAKAGYEENEDGCWIWQHGFSGSAKQACVWVNTKDRINVSRLLWEDMHGKNLASLVLVPKCENGQRCVNPHHKNVVPRSTQQRLAMKEAHKNRSYMQTYMAKKSQMKMTPEKVRRAWEMKSEGALLKDIGAELGVSISTLSVMFNGKTHKHLSPLGFLGNLASSKKTV